MYKTKEKNLAELLLPMDYQDPMFGKFTGKIRFKPGSKTVQYQFQKGGFLRFFSSYNLSPVTRQLIKQLEHEQHEKNKQPKTVIRKRDSSQALNNVPAEYLNNKLTACGYPVPNTGAYWIKDTLFKIFKPGQRFDCGSQYLNIIRINSYGTLTFRVRQSDGSEKFMTKRNLIVGSF